MPVNIIDFPTIAERSLPPSFKRWLIILIVFLVFGSIIIVYFWSADVSTQSSILWFRCLLAPTLIWSVLFGVRWLWYAIADSFSDGWDKIRELELEESIMKGQRFVNVLNQVVSLPHITSSNFISEQAISHDVSLPTEVDVDGNIIKKTNFSDSILPLHSRVLNQLQNLFNNSEFRTVLSQIPKSQKINVSIQIDSPGYTDEIDIYELWGSIVSKNDLPFESLLIEGEGLDVIDRWLDNPSVNEALLIAAVHLVGKQSDGKGEAATALILHSPSSCTIWPNAIAHIHRPEQANAAKKSNIALLQALQWGRVAPKDIEQIWLAGMGIENRARSLFSEAGIEFPKANLPEKHCDIDLKFGFTGKASPWLAIALASAHAAQRLKPQLIMSVPDNNKSKPWFVIVKP